MNHKPEFGSALTVTILTTCIFFLFTLTHLIAALLVDLSREFNTTVAVVGQLITVSGITWALGAPLISPFSDRIGRKRMVVIGLVLSGVSALGYSISWDFSSLIVFSILAGLGGGIMAPNVLASVGDYFSVNIRGRIMSVVYGGVPLSALAGVPAGALIAGSLGWRWSFLLLGLVMIVVALAGIIVLPSSRPHQPDRSIAYLSSFREAFHYRPFLPLVLANTLLQWGYFAIATYLAAFLIQSYSLNIGQVAPFLSLIAVGYLIGSLAGGPLADKLNKLKMCAATPTLAGLTGLALMLFIQNIWLSVFLGGLFMGVYGSGRAPFFSLLVSVPSNIRSTVMGTQAISNHLGRALGALVGGLVLALMGYNYLGVLCLVLTLFASAVFFYIYSVMRETS